MLLYSLPCLGNTEAFFLVSYSCLKLYLSSDFIKQDRLTVSPETYPSLGIAIRNIYKDGGVGAFYAGISPTLVGMLPYSTCFYFMYDTIKESYCRTRNKKSLSRPEMILIGAFAG